ncbi:MAG: hypothetical protein L3J63_11300, partial [Geopsychrobacter sp.]|nr:hypothetical protein [Geopsychrobacter sp.]
MSDEESAHWDKNKVEQIAAALSANSERLFQLVLESDLNLLKLLLRNPNLSDEHLLALLKRRDLAEEIPRLIYQHRKTNISHQLILALVKNSSTAGSLVRNLLPGLRLFELLDLCFIPGVTPDQRLAAERSIIQRLPTTPLGSKISLARRATATVVAELVKEGDAHTFETCLNSPRLKEAAVFQFLNGP